MNIKHSPRENTILGKIKNLFSGFKNIFSKKVYTSEKFSAEEVITADQIYTEVKLISKQVQEMNNKLSGLYSQTIKCHALDCNKKDSAEWTTTKHPRCINSNYCELEDCNFLKRKKY